jgi:AraC-like DNA-binding protein
MHFQIKYNSNKCCEIVTREQLENFSIPYEINNMMIIIKQGISREVFQNLEKNLARYGIEISDDPKRIFLQRIKDAISLVIKNDRALKNRKTSVYLSETLDLSYTHISTVFSEIAYISIENYIILQKIEIAKQMIIDGKYSLTEIAYELNYSSVAHLSNQFKTKIGITPTMFKQIMDEKKTQQLNKIIKL